MYFVIGVMKIFFNDMLRLGSKLTIAILNRRKDSKCLDVAIFTQKRRLKQIRGEKLLNNLRSNYLVPLSMTYYVHKRPHKHLAFYKLPSIKRT